MLRHRLLSLLFAAGCLASAPPRPLPAPAVAAPVVWEDDCPADDAPRPTPLAAMDGGPKNRPPLLVNPGPQRLAEEVAWELHVEVSDPDGDPVRLFVSNLPPGARFDERSRTLTFTPDFIQGGGRNDRMLEFVAQDSVGAESRVQVPLTIADTLRPLPPTLDDRVAGESLDGLRLTVPGDPFLHPRALPTTALVWIPADASATSTRPVKIHLHGFDSGLPSSPPAGDQFHLYPTDPDNSYWWGERSPDGATVPPYTARRVLYLLEWLLDHHPGADPERVTITGSSMGAAGALTLGLLWARHFAQAEGELGQLIPRLHRPGRLRQLEGLWGEVSQALPDGTSLEDGRAVDVWNRLDLTRVVLESPEARDQFVFMRHAKDDTTIHFGAAVHPSPLTGRSAYGAFEEAHLGHLSVWDEGGHGPPDPVLGPRWWDAGWNRITDARTFLRRNRPFPAFSLSSADDDPGDGRGRDGEPHPSESGHRGSVAEPGDTGWSGAVAGALNRFLRWDAAAIVDTSDQLEMPLGLASGAGSPPPREGYPTLGDRYDGPLPVRVDVTPRRVQSFRLRSCETVRWRFGDETGTARANIHGEVTIRRLGLTKTMTRLVLERTPAPPPR
jgi:hypothetical protein